MFTQISRLKMDVVDFWRVVSAVSVQISDICVNKRIKIKIILAGISLVKLWNVVHNKADNFSSWKLCVLYHLSICASIISCNYTVITERLCLKCEYKISVYIYIHVCSIYKLSQYYSSYCMCMLQWRKANCYCSYLFIYIQVHMNGITNCEQLFLMIHSESRTVEQPYEIWKMHKHSCYLHPALGPSDAW